LSGSFITRTFCWTRSSGSVEFPVFLAFFFFVSTGVSSGLNGTRTAERQTPQDAEGRRRRLRSDRSRISYRTYRNRASILLVSGARAAAVFRQGDNFFRFTVSLCRVFCLVCVCVIRNSNLFLTILFVNPTPVNLELRFKTIPFVLRSHRACTSIVGGSREFNF
jgi:hypothetical protein